MAWRILSAMWRRLTGRLQWYLLWLAHSKFIVGISGVVLNDKNEVLLLRHRFWREGVWGLPSGYANRNESLPACFAREVLEETGYRINVEALLRVVSGYKLRLEANYLARLIGGSLRLDRKEVLEARFFPIDALPSELLNSHRELIQLAKSFSGTTRSVDVRRP